MFQERKSISNVLYSSYDVVLLLLIFTRTTQCPKASFAHNAGIKKEKDFL